MAFVAKTPEHREFSRGGRIYQALNRVDFLSFCRERLDYVQYCSGDFRELRKDLDDKKLDPFLVRNNLRTSLENLSEMKKLLDEKIFYDFEGKINYNRYNEMRAEVEKQFDRLTTRIKNVERDYIVTEKPTSKNPLKSIYNVFRSAFGKSKI